MRIVDVCVVKNIDFQSSFRRCCPDLLYPPSLSQVSAANGETETGSIAQSTASPGSIGDFPWRRSFLLFHSDHIPHKIISRSPGLRLALSSKSLVQVLGFSLGNLMPVSCFSFSQNLWSVVYSVNPSNNSHTKQDVPGMKNKANWILLGCGAWQGAPLLCSCTVTGELGGCVEEKIYFNHLILHAFWHTIYSQCVFTRVAINFVSILERILLELVTSLF